MELHLSCTNPSIYTCYVHTTVGILYRIYYIINDLVPTWASKIFCQGQLTEKNLVWNLKQVMNIWLQDSMPQNLMLSPDYDDEEDIFVLA